MSISRIAALAAAAFLSIATQASASPWYLNSAGGGNPWNNTTNDTAMNDVFGAGNWNLGAFETADVATLVATNDLIFLDGSDGGANELETFLTANRATLEAFVFGGGSIFVNSAPNEGDGMDLLLGASLVNSDFCGGDCTVQAAGNAIIDGPFGTLTSVFGGSYFSHATVTGADTALIVQAGTDNGVILGETRYGAGMALFGGMTTTNFHSPGADAVALRNNILAYAAEGVGASAAVPLPASAPLLVAGLGLIGFLRRRAA